MRGIIDAHRPALERHHAGNVAVAVLDNRTGEWLAWEGSGNYFDTEHGGAIDGVIAPRQPGSALKPFTYAAAFERGYHPAQVSPTSRRSFRPPTPACCTARATTTGSSAARCRFGRRWLDRRMCRRSRSRPRLACRRCCASCGGPASRRSIDNAAHYGLGLTLGNAEVRLDEMVAAYASLARGGVYSAPRMVRAIDGRPEPVPQASRVVAERTAFWITDILADAEARAFVFGRGGSLEFPFSVAAKTGTSQAYHDNWAIGYTRDVTVGVWVGNFNRQPLRLFVRGHRRRPDLSRRHAGGGGACDRFAADR